MDWSVILLNEAVRLEYEALPLDMQARFNRVAQLIESHGLERVREPHVKHLEDRLWEIRMTGRDGIARAIYVAAAGRRVVVVRIFVKKTQKIPRGELDLARKRAEEAK